MFYYGGLKYTYPPIFRNVIFANYKIETAMNDEMKYLFRNLVKYYQVHLTDLRSE